MKIISDGGLSLWNSIDTMDAIMLSAYQEYIDGVKLDVRMSLDNILVLSRYDDLSKLTLSSHLVSNSSYDYLKKVKFPSHIFKYYIPTLAEILKRYNHDKIIILELYEETRIDDYLTELMKITDQYPYEFYFMSKNKEIAAKMQGYSNFLLDNEITYDVSSLDNQHFIITANPYKVYQLLNNSTKNT